MSAEDSGQPQNRFIRLRDAAGVLAVSLRTLYRIIGDGHLKIIKVRGCACIARSELERYMSRLAGRAAT